MLYVIFIGLAIAYNLFKFRKERHTFITSLEEASQSHRLMMLSQQFHVFIFEVFLSVIVGRLLAGGESGYGLLAAGLTYLSVLTLGILLYQVFLRFLEARTGLALWVPFRQHVAKELRISFSLILLPIMIYSLISWAIRGDVHEEWGSLWFVGIIFDILFVSLLTIACTVIVMLRLIPNREISEPEYLELINRRMKRLQIDDMRVRWIEADIKNAFVVGLQLFQFSNQTLFIGRKLRTMLTMEEFDAVIAHELAHAVNRHSQRRLMILLKNFISIFTGSIILLLILMGCALLYWGEDFGLHSRTLGVLSVTLTLAWFLLNYALLFDTLRSHEFEADAYAVMEMGASFSALKRALEKLGDQDEMPAYLREKSERKRSRLQERLTSFFSTHPTIEARLSSLADKLNRDLPFDAYLSPWQKAHTYLARFFRWQFLVPCTGIATVALVWTIYTANEGKKLIGFIRQASTQELLASEALVEKINSHPSLLGPSLIYYVVERKERSLIDHFLNRGARKGRTLNYISQLRDIDLFKHYYQRFESELTDEEYYLILRKTAGLNFTDAYRYLVNSNRFERLPASDKQSLARRSQKSTDRKPASAKLPSSVGVDNSNF